MNHYDILRAIKTGYAPDHYTALYARSMSGGSKEYERYISGTPPLILSKSVGKPLVSWSITGNTYNDNPTPEQPIEVKGVGKKIANLFDKNSPSNIVGYGLNTSGIAVSSYRRTTSHYIYVGNVDYIYVSNKTTQNNCFYAEMNENSFIETIIQVTGILKIPSGAKYYRFSADHEEMNRVIVNEGNKPIISDSNCKIPVVCGKHTTNIYLDSPLMADEKLISDGTKEIKWGKMVLTGDESWIYSSTSGIFYITGLQIDYKKTSYPAVNYYSTHFNSSASSTGGAGMKEGEIRFYNGTSSTKEIYIKYTAVGNVNAFKAWLRQQNANGTPVIVYYQLANPLTEAFDVPEIPTVKGNCTIDVDTEVQPKNMTIEYLSSVKDTAMSEMISLLNEV